MEENGCNRLVCRENGDAGTFDNDGFNLDAQGKHRRKASQDEEAEDTHRLPNGIVCEDETVTNGSAIVVVVDDQGDPAAASVLQETHDELTVNLNVDSDNKELKCPLDTKLHHHEDKMLNSRDNLRIDIPDDAVINFDTGRIRTQNHKNKSHSYLSKVLREDSEEEKIPMQNMSRQEDSEKALEASLHNNGKSAEDYIGDPPVANEKQGNGGSTFDEYFSPVNTHKKCLRGEKLYLRNDSEKSCRKWRRVIVCGLITIVAAVAVLVGVLAATGILLAESDSKGPRHPESSLPNLSAISLAGSRLVPRLTTTQSPLTTSTMQPIPIVPVVQPTVSESNVIVPNALIGEFTIIDENFTKDLNDATSHGFLSLAMHLENELKRIFRKNGGDFRELKVLRFRQGSIIVQFVVIWRTDKGLIPAKSAFDLLLHYLKDHGGIFLAFQVNSESLNFTDVIDECRRSRGSCEFDCQWSYLTLNKTCLCPPGKQVAEDGKSCIFETSTSSRASVVESSSATPVSAAQITPITTVSPEVTEANETSSSTVTPEATYNSINTSTIVEDVTVISANELTSPGKEVTSSAETPDPLSTLPPEAPLITEEPETTNAITVTESTTTLPTLVNHEINNLVENTSTLAAVTEEAMTKQLLTTASFDDEMNDVTSSTTPMNLDPASIDDLNVEATTTSPSMTAGLQDAVTHTSSSSATTLLTNLSEHTPTEVTTHSSDTTFWDQTVPSTAADVATSPVAITEATTHPPRIAESIQEQNETSAEVTTHTYPSLSVKNIDEFLTGHPTTGENTTYAWYDIYTSQNAFSSSATPPTFNVTFPPISIIVNLNKTPSYRLFDNYTNMPTTPHINLIEIPASDNDSTVSEHLEVTLLESNTTNTSDITDTATTDGYSTTEVEVPVITDSVSVPEAVVTEPSVATAEMLTTHPQSLTSDSTIILEAIKTENGDHVTISTTGEIMTQPASVGTSPQTISGEMSTLPTSENKPTEPSSGNQSTYTDAVLVVTQPERVSTDAFTTPTPSIIEVPTVQSVDQVSTSPPPNSNITVQPIAELTTKLPPALLHPVTEESSPQSISEETSPQRILEETSPQTMAEETSPQPLVEVTESNTEITTQSTNEVTTAQPFIDVVSVQPTVETTISSIAETAPPSSTEAADATTTSSTDEIITSIPEVQASPISETTEAAKSETQSTIAETKLQSTSATTEQPFDTSTEPIATTTIEPIATTTEQPIAITAKQSISATAAQPTTEEMPTQKATNNTQTPLIKELATLSPTTEPATGVAVTQSTTEETITQPTVEIAHPTETTTIPFTTSGMTPPPTTEFPTTIGNIEDNFTAIIDIDNTTIINDTENATDVVSVDLIDSADNTSTLDYEMAKLFTHEDYDFYNSTMNNTVVNVTEGLICREDQFICEPLNSCLNNTFICDGIEDCPGGIDESNCVDNCSLNFQCINSSSCIMSEAQCDGVWDCSDGTDEQNCTPTECAKHEVMCLDGSTCIKPNHICDWKYNCRDRSDEVGCVERTTCEAGGRFFCNDGLCIPWSLKCDGNFDCKDKEDEGNCTCLEDEFMCNDGKCLRSSSRCDGHRDCLTAEDEMGCVTVDENGIVSAFEPYSGSWSLVCAEDWNLDDGHYLCQELGFGHALSTSKQHVLFNGTWMASKRDNLTASSLWTERLTFAESCVSDLAAAVECQKFDCGNYSGLLHRRRKRQSDGSSPSSSSTQWPFIAYVSTFQSTKGCLSEILTPVWLVTSAECLLSIGKEPHNGSDWYVRTNVALGFGDSQAQKHEVLKILPHSHSSKFRSLILRDYDVALVRLKHALVFSDKIGAICLPEEQVPSGITCFSGILGSEKPRAPSPESPTISSLALMVMDRDSCNVPDHYNNQINQRMLCTRSSDSQSVCDNDEGTPLMCLSGPNKWYVAGMLTYQRFCGAYNWHPAVFSNLFAMRNFIDQVTGQKLYGVQYDSNVYVILPPTTEGPTTVTMATTELGTDHEMYRDANFSMPEHYNTSNESDYLWTSNTTGLDELLGIEVTTSNESVLIVTTIGNISLDYASMPESLPLNGSHEYLALKQPEALDYDMVDNSTISNVTTVPTETSMITTFATEDTTLTPAILEINASLSGDSENKFDGILESNHTLANLESNVTNLQRSTTFDNNTDSIFENGTDEIPRIEDTAANLSSVNDNKLTTKSPDTLNTTSDLFNSTLVERLFEHNATDSTRDFVLSSLPSTEDLSLLPTNGSLESSDKSTHYLVDAVTLPSVNVSATPSDSITVSTMNDLDVIFNESLSSSFNSSSENLIVENSTSTEGLYYSTVPSTMADDITTTERPSSPEEDIPPNETDNITSADTDHMVRKSNLTILEASNSLMLLNVSDAATELVGPKDIEILNNHDISKNISEISNSTSGVLNEGTFTISSTNLLATVSPAENSTEISSTPTLLQESPTTISPTNDTMTN